MSAAIVLLARLARLAVVFTQGVFPGSCVIVDYRGEQRYGVIRWIGVVLDDKCEDEVQSAAVEIVS